MIESIKNKNVILEIHSDWLEDNGYFLNAKECRYNLDFTQNKQMIKDNQKDIQKGEDMKKIINEFKVWIKFKSLYYRTEIIWFVIGFIVGAILI